MEIESNTMTLADAAKQLAHQELARRSLFEFANYLTPTFFFPERYHLIEVCNTLQALYEGKLLKSDGTPFKKLMINLPPRHGKSFSAIKFNGWVLGIDNSNKIFTVSYNETLSSRFSKGVRNMITQEKIIFHIHC